MSPSRVCQITTTREINVPGTFDPSFITANDNWFQELIRFVVLISLFDGGNRVFTFLTPAIDQTLDGDFDPLPPLVTVHGVVPSDDGNELSDLLLFYEIEEILRVLGRGTGSSITTIPEEVEVDMWNFELLRCLEKRE